MKTTEIVLVFLTMELALLSPPVLVSHVARNGYQEDLVHTFLRGRSEDDCPGVPRIILVPFLKMRCNVWRSLVVGASPKLPNLSKMTERSLTVTSASSLNTVRQISSGLMDL